jgi:hypothetical protein
VLASTTCSATSHKGHSSHHKQELGSDKINKQEQHQGSPCCPSKLFHDSHSSHNSFSTTEVQELVIKLR